MANWSGAGSGALSGAALGSSFGPIGTAVGAAGGGLLGLFSKKKKSSDSLYYPFNPYSGYRPPHIDTEGQQILRPTQKQDFDITMRRSLGQDVGYDPSWMTSSVDLTKNELGRAKEDALRSNRGALSAAGLSGNPRAYEATAGRTDRNYLTDLENALSRLNILNMEASRADKNSATDRLAALNRFNFGQENKVADFDLDVYNRENAARQGSFVTNLGAEKYYDTEAENDALGNMGFLSETAQNLGPSVQAYFTPKTYGQGATPNFLSASELVKQNKLNQGKAGRNLTY